MIPLPSNGKKPEYYAAYFHVSGDLNFNFNCWGFVAKVAGWHEYFTWLDDYDMMDLLNRHTEKVTEPQEGDIIAFYRHEISTEGLNHTAFFRNGNLVLHKMGGLPIATDSLHAAKERYGNLVTFHRIKNLTNQPSVLQ